MAIIKKVPISGKQTVGILIIFPSTYDPVKEYKALLGAHGIGERGNNLAVIENWLNDPNAGAPNLISLADRANQVIVMPQLPGGDWYPELFDAAYNYITTNFKINLKVFITGISLGGQEIWLWASLNPDKVAGIIACCAKYSYIAKYDKITMPVLAYHAQNDSIVGIGEGMMAINQIKEQAKPFVPPEMITYETGDHYIWNKVYAEPRVKSFLMGTGEVTPTPNPIPVPSNLKADASDTVNEITGNTALLNASKSTGYKNVPGYKQISWELISGPKGVGPEIFPNYNKIGEFVTVTGLIPGLYVFRCTVGDGKGNFDSNDVTINVKELVQAKVFVAADVPTGAKHITVYEDKSLKFD